MINKRRVQRIRNIIYAFLVLLFFVPFLILVVLGFRMTGAISNLTELYEKTRTEQLVQTGENSATEPWEHSRSSSESESVYSQAQSPFADHSGSTIAPDSEEDRAAAPSEADTQIVAPDGEDEDGGMAPPVSNSSGNPQSGAVVAGQGGESGRYVENTYLPASHPQLFFNSLPVASSTPDQTLYITIDNTPSSEADELLQILEKHGVPATFFVWWNVGMDEKNAAFYRRLVGSGHQVGIRCGTNLDTLSDLYESADSFLTRFENAFNTIYEQTGIRTRLYRLPGGSAGSGDEARQAVITEVKFELDSRGFVQYDWNASAQDAVRPSLSKEQILANLRSTVSDRGNAVVLLHDGTGSLSTVHALDEFIGEYTALGYEFRPLEYNTPSVSFLDQ